MELIMKNRTVWVIIALVLTSQAFVSAYVSFQKYEKGKNYTANIIKYLQSYGYLDKTQPSDTDMHFAVETFQTYFGLAETGSVTEATFNLMHKHRCGEKDLPLNLQMARAHKQTWTYSIQAWSKYMDRRLQNKTVHNALKEWTNITPFNLYWAKTSNINIYFTAEIVNSKGIYLPLSLVTTRIFQRSEHHYEIYINENTTLTAGNLKNITSHAFGHVLGYNHKGEAAAAMFPLFDSEVTPPDPAGPCDISIDAITNHMVDGKTYIFKDDMYWRITDKYTVDVGYPKNISDFWYGVPTPVDEVFSFSGDWQTYFLKNKFVYKWDAQNKTISSRYPKRLKNAWKNVPDGADAVITNFEMNTLFIKDDLVYVIDENEKRLRGFPASLNAVFPGLPRNIDTALHYYYDNELYFFKGLNYYRWNKRFNQVDGPLKIKDLWLNLCLPFS